MQSAKNLLIVVFSGVFMANGPTGLNEKQSNESKAHRSGRYAKDNPNEACLKQEAAVVQESDWNLSVNGFSPAYLDDAREAIAINTLEQPADKWAAATKTFEGKTGVYTIKFTTLLEKDGESTYKVKIDERKVIDFKNPRIFGKNIPEYEQYVITVKDIKIKKGSVIQVEFLPDSNGLVEEDDGFAYARARWSPDIDFILQ